MNEIDIQHLLTQDIHIDEILQIVRDLRLKDSWLCAGTIRNYIWNIQSGRAGFDGTTDIDVVFYDPEISYEATLALEQTLCAKHPQYQWELKNQVYMHVHSPDTSPYTDSRDAISKYPERCTAVGMRLNDYNQVEFFCPYGWESILSMEIHPTPHFLENPKRMAVYQARLQKKNWKAKWEKLKIFWE